MNKTKKLFLSIGMMALVFLFTSGRALAVECKTLTRNACIQSAQCTWVHGYTRKDGRKVAAYCRKKSSVKKNKRAASKGATASAAPATAVKSAQSKGKSSKKSDKKKDSKKKTGKKDDKKSKKKSDRKKSK